MKVTLLFPMYIWWHYAKAPFVILSLIGHFVTHIFHFFSVTTLLKTLFSPWRRLSEGYPENFDLGQVFTSVIVNTLMRVVGAMIRTVTIVLGLFFTLLFSVLGLLFFIYWLVMPVAVVFLMVWGFTVMIIY